MNDLSLAYLMSGEDGYNSAEAVFAALNISAAPDLSLSIQRADSPAGSPRR
jgi:hypothetical protein